MKMTQYFTLSQETDELQTAFQAQASPHSVYPT